MSWLDPTWRYQAASTHGDLAAFAQRQQERLRAAKEQRKAAPPASVQQIKRRSA